LLVDGMNRILEALKHTDPDPEHCRKVHGKDKQTPEKFMGRKCRLQKRTWKGNA
jgi:hypothetical protein